MALFVLRAPRSYGYTAWMRARSMAVSAAGRGGSRMCSPGHGDANDAILPSARIKRRKDSGPFSIFVSPTCEWKDFFRSQVRERQQRKTRSPFVQRAYDRFVQTHPHVKHCGLPKRYLAKSYRTPWMPREYQHPLPAFSYLKDRLQKKNRPQTTARRNSLLRSRQQTQPLEVLLRPRARRRAASRPPVCFPGQLPLASKRTAASVAPACRRTRRGTPKRHAVQRINRFSRHRCC